MLRWWLFSQSYLTLWDHMDCSTLGLLSFCPQSFPASETFPVSQLFVSDDQNTRVSASASALPMNIQGWFPLRKCSLLQMAQMVKNLPEMRETWVGSLGWEDPLEEGMATYSSILAWRIPWTEEPGGLQSIGSQRVRHNWVTKHSTASFKFSCIFFQKGKRCGNCRILSIFDHKTL